MGDGRSVSPPTVAGPARKVANYTSAIFRWLSAGRPVRTDEEVARIYHEICQRCDRLRNGECIECGCRIAPPEGENPISGALANKLRMATEHCPIDKW